MSTIDFNAAGAAPSAPERPLFPLIRHLSSRTTPLLARTPLSANQITAISLMIGLGASWCMAVPGQMTAVAGAALLIACYVLDNCDGEIARLKGQSSEFGRRFDNFVDWAVHTAFFACLGIGASQNGGSEFWLWCGWAAAIGSTINFIIGTIAEERERIARERSPAPAAQASPAAPPPLDGWYDHLMHAFRELSRADFCFIVLFLSAFDAVWLLLPTGALGAQAFWIVHLLPDARQRHV